ncbi:L,D-transpeptidase [Gorillibacterium sp. sgz5001074]|uniref:L,D-transpeptidase n=1 Tax=Gorillibacterium sp. sgz5001074 TaxID=3446695 RepID=UPI003F66DFD5
MNDKNPDEQLQAFFEHNPLNDDMDYLKSYVKDHPENKMGWYLLGKAYEARNKPGKAKYCYAQSGEVYEAFEKRKVELGLLEEFKADRPVLPGQKDRRRPLYRTLRLSAAVGVALMMGSFFHTDGKEGTAGSGEDATKPFHVSDGAGGAKEGTAWPQGPQVLYMNPVFPLSQDAVWKQFLLSGSVKNRTTLLAEGKLTSDGKWVNGLRKPELLASGTTPAEGGELRVVYRRAELCNCTPDKDGDAEAAVERWVTEREETVLVESAVRAYQSRYGGALPAELDGLVRDYPHNILPGYTEGMKRVYKDILARSRSGAQEAGGGNWPGYTAGGTVRKQAAGEGYLEAPLEIIVDKSAFRLALVSGSVILRSYPVGLGGARTPEGVFTISDKVKNPNGRDDGDFGSRGMQLSDTDYAIHGTKEPRSIGENRSLGCIRMLKEDIEELFDMTPSGTKVTIGTGLLPPETLRKEKTFRLPALREERNPSKIYHWLD